MRVRKGSIRELQWLKYLKHDHKFQQPEFGFAPLVSLPAYVCLCRVPSKTTPEKSHPNEPPLELFFSPDSHCQNSNRSHWLKHSHWSSDFFAGLQDCAGITPSPETIRVSLEQWLPWVVKGLLNKVFRSEFQKSSKASEELEQGSLKGSNSWTVVVETKPINKPAKTPGHKTPFIPTSTNHGNSFVIIIPPRLPLDYLGLNISM